MYTHCLNSLSKVVPLGQVGTPQPLWHSPVQELGRTGEQTPNPSPWKCQAHPQPCPSSCSSCRGTAGRGETPLPPLQGHPLRVTALLTFLHLLQPQATLLPQDQNFFNHLDMGLYLVRVLARTFFHACGHFLQKQMFLLQPWACCHGGKARESQGLRQLGPQRSDVVCGRGAGDLECNDSPTCAGICPSWRAGGRQTVSSLNPRRADLGPEDLHFRRHSPDSEIHSSASTTQSHRQGLGAAWALGPQQQTHRQRLLPSGACLLRGEMKQCKDPGSKPQDRSEGRQALEKREVERRGHPTGQQEAWAAVWNGQWERPC